MLQIYFQVERISGANEAKFLNHLEIWGYFGKGFEAHHVCSSTESVRPPARVAATLYQEQVTNKFTIKNNNLQTSHLLRLAEIHLHNCASQAEPQA